MAWNKPKSFVKKSDGTFYLYEDWLKLEKIRIEKSTGYECVIKNKVDKTNTRVTALLYKDIMDVKIREDDSILSFSPTKGKDEKETEINL